MKKIIYTREDGGLSILHPVRNTYPKLEDLTDDELLERAKKDIPKGVKFVILDESEIPTDRTFRAAWILEKGKVSHDMARCQEIHKARIRQHRKPLLEKLDVEFMKALESDPQKVKAIKDKKQVLRDLTKDPKLLGAKNPEEVKAFWPFEEGQ